MNKKLRNNGMIDVFLSYTFLFTILSFFICFFFLDKLNDLNIVQEYINDFGSFRSMLINFLNTGDFSFLILKSDFICFVGDFLSYSSIFLKESNLNVLYWVLMFIRMYLVGLSFVVFSKYKKFSNNASIVGAIIYTFSMLSLSAILKNSYFLNLMIFFPFLMIGVEKVILENKKLLFIVFVSLCLFSNLYFMFFIGLFVYVYGTILIFGKYREYGLKLIVFAYLRILFCNFISILIVSVFLSPYIYQMIVSNNFFNINYYFYYNDIFSLGLKNDLLVYLNGLAFIYLPLSMKKNKNNFNLSLFMMIIFVLSLIIGFDLFNSNFTVFIVFLSSILIANTFDLFISLSKSDFKWIISFMCICFLVLVLCYELVSELVIVSFFTAFVFLIILLNKKELSSFLGKYNIFNLVFYVFLIFSSCLLINSFYNQILENENINVLEFSIDENNIISLDDFTKINR